MYKERKMGVGRLLAQWDECEIGADEYLRQEREWRWCEDLCAARGGADRRC